MTQAQHKHTCRFVAASECKRCETGLHVLMAGSVLHVEQSDRIPSTCASRADNSPLKRTSGADRWMARSTLITSLLVVFTQDLGCDRISTGQEAVSKACWVALQASHC